MRRLDGRLLLSSGDLVAFLGCRHASSLDFRALDEDMETSDDDPTLALIQDKGIAHEQAYLERLEGGGRRVARIPDKGLLPEKVAMTLQAMKDGYEVIYQAALMRGAWHGFADFLEREPLPSTLGGWSYAVSDTKLSSSVKARHAVQLAVYSDMVASIQGVQPRRMSVALGDGRLEHLRPGDFTHYVRLAAQRLEAFLGDEAARGATVSDPCAWCEMCRWRDRCKAEWDAFGHLSLVANIRKSQRVKLVAAGIDTVDRLAQLPEGIQVAGMTTEILGRLRAQARLQVAVRGTDEHRFELQPAAPGRAFARMPAPDPGDLFFDMEGDPLYRDPIHDHGGLEYLFGVHWGDPQAGTFLAFWAHDRAEERRALEEFLDFVTNHLVAHPKAHIYHYGHYEVTAVRRLAMRHATRETIVDDLLRRQKFVDLFKTVREGMLISEPHYSLKNVEKFYLGKRGGEVATAGDSIVAYEQWRVSQEQHILDEIESYNAIDCRSTAALRDWLLTIRPAETPWFVSEEVAPDEEASSRQVQAEAERQAIEDALLTGVLKEELPFRRLVVDLVEFHRREQKPEWWALFDRQGRDEDALIDDAECLGGLRLVGEPMADKRSMLFTYRFPAQETKLKNGDRPVLVDTMESAGSIESLDTGKGLITIKRGNGKADLPPALNLGPGGPVEDRVLRAAIRRFADSVATRSAKFRAVEGFLKREAPRLHGHAPGQPVVAAGENQVKGAIAAALELDHSHLFIQGPPGCGKTYTSSHMIVELLRRGKRVGVSSNSHKAVNNLLSGVVKAAGEVGFRFQGFKKSTAGAPETEFDGDMVENYTDAKLIPTNGALLAGTAWLFAREEFEGVVDYLFIDEAGQVSLANLVAMGTAAKNIVLVGDQQQLGQPVQGTHPGESGASCLEHLLQGAATVPADRGIFLEVTWRMHPDVCAWVSEAIYDGRLVTEPSTANQTLLLDEKAHPALAPTGLRFLPVAHSGRGQRAPEEVAVIKEMWISLQGQRWRDRHGEEHIIGPDDVLVVAPYNVQTNAIREALPNARVGTVDKFQGQEAPVVLISMTTSSGDDLPRDVEFLFSRNRLNVAISRAKCLAVVVANPRLLEVNCGSVEDMRLVDTLCHAYEWSLRSGEGDV